MLFPLLTIRNHGQILVPYIIWPLAAACILKIRGTVYELHDQESKGKGGNDCHEKSFDIVKRTFFC